MKKHTQDFTEGNLWIQIFKFSVPLIFSNLLQVLFNMADIAVVGRFAGSNALGSVGITIYGGVSGDADAAVAALLADCLNYNPNATCSHHGEGHHHEEGHSCGTHSCGSHSCH